MMKGILVKDDYFRMMREGKELILATGSHTRRRYVGKAGTLQLLHSYY